MIRKLRLSGGAVNGNNAKVGSVLYTYAGGSSELIIKPDNQP